ncbi:hypothetical protein C1I99_01180 [Micromonospora deserti]|uniref:Adenylyltransferase AadA C-terminal domain-containing protein n=1 Tax=Micromonospora deserti TaxID=2070366 RepID=A0A2W2CWA0_9ACTN|nr:hypothetical protein C1I99_01180 [Micromonospora deserti]
MRGVGSTDDAWLWPAVRPFGDAGKAQHDRALLDTRNVIVTLARIRTTLATGGIRSKDAAADFVLDRLPAAHRPVLADDARAIYRGLAAETWDALRDRVRRHAAH